VNTDAVGVDSVREGPGVLVGLDQTVGQWLWDVVEVDELLDARLLLVEFLRSLVDAKHDRRYVAEYGGAHQRWNDRQVMIYKGNVIYYKRDVM